MAIALPKVMSYLWQPWYAKLWWTCSAIFWIGALVVSSLNLHVPGSTEGALKVLAVGLHPLVALPVLGFGFCRAWLRLKCREPADEGGVNGAGELSFSESREPLSFFADASDPRSPLNPLNPVNAANFDFRR